MLGVLYFDTARTSFLGILPGWQDLAQDATKLFWSRSGIMHVAIAWDHKPLLLLAAGLLPNRSTESFEREERRRKSRRNDRKILKNIKRIWERSKEISCCSSKDIWIPPRKNPSLFFEEPAVSFVLTFFSCLLSSVQPVLQGTVTGVTFELFGSH